VVVLCRLFAVLLVVDWRMNEFTDTCWLRLTYTEESAIVKLTTRLGHELWLLPIGFGEHELGVLTGGTVYAALTFAYCRC